MAVIIVKPKFSHSRRIYFQGNSRDKATGTQQSNIENFFSVFPQVVESKQQKQWKKFASRSKE